MTESDRIDAFNHHLDRLLSAAEPDGRGLNYSEQEAIFPAAALAAVRFDAELRPRPGLKERWQKQAARRQPRPALRPAWAVGAWAAAAVALIALLVIFHQPVLASLGRLFGFAYLPEAGFVNLNEVRVLQNAVTQRHDGRQLSALRGLVTARGTDLWLEFDDEARPIDGAWLLTPYGQRFDLLNWAYSPDEPGTRGVVALFPSLPPEIEAVTLALPEGWRLPLSWVPGTDSALAPADIVAAPPAEPEGTPKGDLESTPADEPGEVSSENLAAVESPAGEPLPCAEALEVRFCVQAAARTQDGMDVLVEAVPGGPYAPGSGYSPSLFDVPGEMQDLALTGADGSRYPVDADHIQVAGEPAGRLSTLRFPGAQALAGPLSLTVPAVLVSVPLSAPLAGEVVIDLGDDPRPGQTLDIDQTVDVASMPVHFSQAVLEGDWTNSLVLRLTSDPLDDRAPLRPYLLEPGRPEGIQDRWGAGSGPDHLSISVDLRQPDGLKTGLLRIPLLSAALKVRGPFSLTFDAPAAQHEITPEPTPEAQVIDGGLFEPLPAGEQLPMDTFQYSGRLLQPGDLLAAARQGGSSVVYAASPAAGFAPEPLAVLPGQVLAVYPHPDYQGIDYLTGEVDEASSTTLYRQLYTLRFGDPSPRLLVGQFERSAFNFAWSFDGRFLAYLMTDDRPGQTFQRFIRLIDLDCRAAGECSPFTADIGEQDLSWIEWSPNVYRMSAGGPVNAQEASGSSDIFLLNLDADSGAVELTNLTQSPAINDMAPAHWAPGGEALFYACETGWADPNAYFLCRNDLNEGVDELILPVLPWNMHSLHLAAGRRVVDRTPVLINGVYSLRTFDLETGDTGTLLEWPATGKVPVETSVSPDGRWAAAAIDDLGGLLALNLATHESSLVLPVDAGRFLWVGWVE